MSSAWRDVRVKYCFDQAFLVFCTHLQPMRQVEADLVPKEGIGEEDVKPRPLLHQVLDDGHRIVLDAKGLAVHVRQVGPVIVALQQQLGILLPECSQVGLTVDLGYSLDVLREYKGPLFLLCSIAMRLLKVADLK